MGEVNLCAQFNKVEVILNLYDQGPHHQFGADVGILQYDLEVLSAEMLDKMQYLVRVVDVAENFDY